MEIGRKGISRRKKGRCGGRGGRSRWCIRVGEAACFEVRKGVERGQEGV